MEKWIVVTLFCSAFCSLDPKEINLYELEEQFMADEDQLPEDLPEFKREKPPIDMTKVHLKSLFSSSHMIPISIVFAYCDNYFSVLNCEFQW